MGANSFGCIVGTPNVTTLAADEPSTWPTEEEVRGEGPERLGPADLSALLKTMAVLTKRDITSFSPKFKYHRSMSVCLSVSLSRYLSVISSVAIV